MPKEERQIKEITDKDLDTGRDLITENYELEILTLKDKVDLRRFSRSFLKVDKLLKSIFTGKEDKFPKNSGFNREKTDLVENDTNKVFSAKGAFDLKTYLITNYTTLMNNIRDTLTNSINTKLPHGGYNQSAQTLKNEIDTKVFRNSININTSVDFNNFETSGFYNVYKASGVVFTNAPTSFDFGTLLVIGQGKSGLSFVTQILTEKSSGCTYIRTRNDGLMAWTNWASMYGTNNKPSKADVGLGNVPNYPAESSVSDSSDEKLATAGAVKKANDNANGRVSKSGDTINGSLTLITTANERIITCSQSWGMYFNSGGVGWFDWANSRSILGYGASTGIITISTATIMAHTLHQNGLLNFNARKSSDYYMEMLPSGPSNPSGSKNLIRKMRGGDGDSIWHEVVQGNTWKLATGNTDSTVQIEVSSGNLAMPGNITSRGNSVVTGIRLGTVVSRAVWMSAQSATEDKGYVTVAVRNSNADDHVDSELRRPLQILVNGSWVTVSTL